MGHNGMDLRTGGLRDRRGLSDGGWPEGAGGCGRRMEDDGERGENCAECDNRVMISAKSLSGSKMANRARPAYDDGIPEGGPLGRRQPNNLSASGVFLAVSSLSGRSLPPEMETIPKRSRKHLNTLMR